MLIPTTFLFFISLISSISCLTLYLLSYLTYPQLIFIPLRLRFTLPTSSSSATFTFSYTFFIFSFQTSFITLAHNFQLFSTLLFPFHKVRYSCHELFLNLYLPTLSFSIKWVFCYYFLSFSYFLFFPFYYVQLSFLFSSQMSS